MGWRRTARLFEPQEQRHSPPKAAGFVLGAPPHAPLMRRPRRGRRPKGRNNSGTSTDQFCRIRAARSEGGPKAQRASPAVRRTAKARTTAQPNAAGKPKTVSRPKLAPALRSVPASLRLRFRSAGAARHPKDGPVYFINVARGNSCRIGSPPTGRICPLKRAGDGFYARGSSFFARLARFNYIRLSPK